MKDFFICKEFVFNSWALKNWNKILFKKCEQSMTIDFLEKPIKIFIKDL